MKRFRSCMLGFLLFISTVLLSLMAPSQASASEGWTWQNPKPRGGFRYEAVCSIDATRAWAVGTGGVIVATDDGGATWTERPSPTTLTLRSVSFADASSGWATGDSGVLLATLDGGQTWMEQDSNSTGHLYGISSIDTTRAWAVGQRGTVLFTTDGGLNWRYKDVGSSKTFYEVDFVDASHGWIVGEGGTVLRTVDGGTSWQQLVYPRTGDLFAASFVTTGTGWVAGDSGGYVYYTTDGGDNWQPQQAPVNIRITSISACATNTAFAVSDVFVIRYSGLPIWSMSAYGYVFGTGVTCPDAGHAWAVSRGAANIVATSDGGTTWTSQASVMKWAPALQALDFADSDHGWAVGDNLGEPGGNNRVLRTTDGGQNWTPRDAATGANIWAMSFADEQNGWAGGYNGPMCRTSDGGDTWESVAPPGSTVFALAFVDSASGWASGATFPDFGVYYTDNRGDTWTRQSCETSSPIRDLDFIDANNGWGVGYIGTIVRTDDAGASWDRQSSGTTQTLIGVVLADDRCGWAVGAGGTILHTSDGGTTWESQASGTTTDIQAVACASDSRALAVGNNLILRTDDGGKTWWRQQDTGEQLYDVDAMGIYDAAVCGSGCSLLRTTSGGEDRLPTSLSLSTAPTVVSYAGSSRLSGAILDPFDAMLPYKCVTLQRSYDGHGWEDLDRLNSYTGGYSYTVAPITRKTYYRLLFAGDGSYYGGPSPSVTVTPSAYLSTPRAPSPVYRRRLFSVYGHMKPTHAPGLYSVRLDCYRYESRRWVRRRTFATRNLPAGSYTKYAGTISLTLSGRWKIRAYHAADAEHAATYSGYRAVTVR